MKLMKKIRFCKGFTLVEIMIGVGIIALIAAIAIPNLLRARIMANETVAKATLSAIGKALEMYYSINSVYPNAEADILSPNSSPPYLSTSFDGQTIKGYQYNYQLGGAAYTVTATPQSCGVTGQKVFTVQTNNVITEAQCVP